MIDLRQKELPCTIQSGGKAYKIKTDFRDWISWGHVYEEEGIAEFSIFDGKRPPLEQRDWLIEAMAFYESKNATPNFPASSGPRSLDLVLDGEYIVAAFMQCYGIDLTAVDYMHWHLFKALLNGLPDDAKLSQIMGYRSWRNDKTRYEQQMARLKQAWALPERGAEKALEEARAAAERMYEAQNGA